VVVYWHCYRLNCYCLAPKIDLLEVPLLALAAAADTLVHAAADNSGSSLMEAIEIVEGLLLQLLAKTFETTARYYFR